MWLWDWAQAQPLTTGSDTIESREPISGSFPCTTSTLLLRVGVQPMVELFPTSAEDLDFTQHQPEQTTKNLFKLGPFSEMPYEFPSLFAFAYIGPL